MRRMPSRHWLSILGLALFLAWFPLNALADAESDVCTTLTSFNVLGCFSFLMNGVVHLMTTILLFLLDIFIGITQYNHFADAPFVVAGWIVVRDVVNMFFIVVLLVSAFATIIRYNRSEFHYTKVLPKLLLYAILINFSKTFLLMGVDFSQVIMLTFVNAFKDAAAGNFVVGFGLQQIITSANTSSTVSTISVIMTWFLALLLILVMIMVVIAMIVFVLVRIMGLWILLTLSPAAFFASALPGKMQKALNTFTGDFWSKYNAFLTGGPIMAFFLYLTLATIQLASQNQQGDLGRATNLFTANNTQGVVGNVVSNFSSSTLATFVFAITMMLLGLQAGADASKAIGGAGAAAISGIAKGTKDFVGTAARGAALAPVAATALALRGTGALAVGTGRVVAGTAAATAKGINERFDVTGKAARAGMRIPIVRSAFRKELAGASSAVQAARSKSADEILGQTKGLNTADKVAFLNSLGTGVTASPAERLAHAKLQADLANDPEYQKIREQQLQKDARIDAAKGGIKAAIGGAFAGLRSNGANYDRAVGDATDTYGKGLADAWQKRKSGAISEAEFADIKGKLAKDKDDKLAAAKQERARGRGFFRNAASGLVAGATAGRSLSAEEVGKVSSQIGTVKKAFEDAKAKAKGDYDTGKSALEATHEKQWSSLGAGFKKRSDDLKKGLDKQSLSLAEYNSLNDQLQNERAKAEAELAKKQSDELADLAKRRDDAMKAAKDTFTAEIAKVTVVDQSGFGGAMGAANDAQAVAANVSASIDMKAKQGILADVNGTIKQERMQSLDASYKAAVEMKDKALEDKVKDIWKASPHLILDQKEFDKTVQKIREDGKLQEALKPEALKDPRFLESLAGGKIADEAETNRVIDSLSKKIREKVRGEVDKLRKFQQAPNGGFMTSTS